MTTHTSPGMLTYGSCQPMPLTIAVPSQRGDAIRAICPLPIRCMGQCRKTQAWHGISPSSARQDHQRREGVQPIAAWMHPHQACHHSLDEVACKVTQLIIIGIDWVYAFTWLHEGTLHTPLSSDGHISAMIDGTPSMMPVGTSAN